MQPLKKRLETLQGQLADAATSLKLDQKSVQIQEIEQALSLPDAWNDPSESTTRAKQLSDLKTIISPWQNIIEQTTSLVEMLSIADESMLAEIESQTKTLEVEYQKQRKDLLFDGPYDDHDAVLRLSAGAGGVDAMDWTGMLLRMYTRWAEKSGIKAELIEQSSGEEAGIKSATLSLSGPFAFGKLRSEHGVHRLVRLSPFNSDNLRQTSFALVEVLPEIDTPDEVVVDEKDLKIDVYRAGGHGGQSVNTTDSAVRITHVPTNIVISIQNERSQLQNRETAMKILRSKLAQLQLEQHAESLSELKATESANWGSQIRNYVLHPYTLVKDTRTKHETGDAQGVLDGKLDEFIEAYLSQVKDDKN